MKSPVPKKRMRSEIWAPSMNDPPTVIGASPALPNRLLAAVGKPTADHKRVFSAAASRRGDRIRASWIAALLSAMIVLTAVHRTQAQPAPDASWINLRASASHSSELVTTKEDLRLRYVEGRNFGVGKISLLTGSGGTRCEMSPEEFHKFYPPLLEWIRNTLDANAHVAQTVSSRGFSRLPHYFTKHTLVTTKVVIVDPLPVPPLASMGLTRFADFLRGDSDGITYIDTIFLKPAQSENENVYFHELIHVIQWRLLGPDRFLLGTRMAWNALAIGRVRWKLWRMMQNQSSLALRLFSTQKSWSRTNSACKAATLLRHQN